MIGAAITPDLTKAILEERYDVARRRRLESQTRRRRRQEREQPYRARTPESPGRRLTTVLFAGAALGATAHIAVATISVLAVTEVTGDAALAGLPLAASVMGTALGSVLLPRLFAMRGLRIGLNVAYATAAAGNVICLFALSALSLPLLLLGMVMSGVGNAGNQLSRYAASESYPPQRRASVVGLIVWAGAFGSVLGPLLLAPSASIAGRLGRSELAGGFMVGAVFMAAVTVLYLIALPAVPASRSVASSLDTRRANLRGALTRPSVRVAMTALVGSQVVMVTIMAAAPLHVSHHGPALGEVGLVMTAHTLGMYALAPVIGRTADRRGATPMLLSGMALLGAAAFAGATLTTGSTALVAAILFALGLGWSLAFVSGSSILSRETGELGTGFQGHADALTWIAGGTATIGSGAIYSAGDFATVSLVGLVLVTATTLVIAWGWRPSAPALADAN
jgi:MFS family permease